MGIPHKDTNTTASISQIGHEGEYHTAENHGSCYHLVFFVVLSDIRKYTVIATFIGYKKKTCEQRIFNGELHAVDLNISVLFLL